MRDERGTFKHTSDQRSEYRAGLATRMTLGGNDRNEGERGDPRKKIHLQGCRETWRCHFIRDTMHTQRIKFRESYAAGEQHEKY